ncbi:hypothetical protein AALO_G00009430 [Alosa alosa]|uniref:NAD(P)(+)--arginine ADP-ribosyltransferase n=1 Tax=Alosa alosa TaxID=278164 RepID=A0AAV6HFU2_9TELE|nr:ecto-ADP-ribosyltransferase 5 isoform X1 [Alosa alosa]KAG5285959.1 hypothetical protein AALO_G00009430 [Alosa alosa]
MVLQLYWVTMAGWEMWYTSLVLFATVTHKVSSNSFEMDLAPNAVDDAYSACREQMLQKILAKDGGILQTELDNSSEFKSAWDGSKGCVELISGGQHEHTRALQSFSNSRKLFKKVNGAVKTNGGNVDDYTNKFQFKSLHFLMMDAMRLLKNGTNCRTVYSSTFDDINAVKGAEVRFGAFVSANADRSFTEEGCTDGGTLFNITTCSLINLENRVCALDEVSMLISPVELFKVVDVKSKTDCNREIVLTSLGFKSDHDCYLFPRVATPTAHTTSATTDSSDIGSSTQWMSSRGVVLLTTLLSMCSIFLAL